MRIPRLTKTHYVSGLRCRRKLWWEVHEPRAPELVPDDVARWRMEQGRAAGLEARRFVPHSEYERRVATATGLAAIDILEPLALGHVLIEVKASTGVRPEHLPDVAYQWYLAHASGLPVSRAEVMHLNSACRYPDRDALFIRHDVTEAILPLAEEVPRRLAELREALSGDLPRTPTGRHCREPHRCPFFARCHSEPSLDDISRLYQLQPRRRAALERRGITRISQIPDDEELSPVQARQRQALRTNRRVVEPGMGHQLAALVEPLAFLDFETVSTAIPLYPGTAPWESVPAQFSLHRLLPDGGMAHHQWLAEGAEDPRPGLAARLVEGCAGAGSVIGYNTSFESECLAQLVRVAPRLAPDLERIRASLVDLLPLVRDHIYDPEFGGSFSLKAVLPALVPGPGHDALAISRGDDASATLARLIHQPDRWSPAEREERRRQLAAYCAHDTLGLVRLLERLRGLAAAADMKESS
jgi:hypothetical protein